MPAAPTAPTPLWPLLETRLGDVPPALSLARRGALQAAVLAAAAIRNGGTAEEAPSPTQSRPPLLRLEIGQTIAWCQGGSIRLGPDPTRAIPLNGDTPRLAADKPTLNRLLAAQGFSCPPGQAFTAGDRAAALAWANGMAGPVCIKPPSGSLGWGVAPGLSGDAAVGDAFDTVAARCGAALVEQHVSSGPPLLPGATVRMMWVAPDHITLRMDVPAAVTGDGRRPVSALLAERNASRAARTGQPPILPDAALLTRLADQGHSLSSLPAAGQRVALRAVSNASQGGDSHTDLPEIHPSYAAEVIRLFRSLPGTRAGAADLALADLTAPCRPDNHWILDVNLSPGIVQYHFPWSGPPRDVAAALVQMLARITVGRPA